MASDEAIRPARDHLLRARILAAAGLVVYVVALFLPLHFDGPGHFGNAFYPHLGTRLTIGFLILDFTLPFVISVGLLLLRQQNVLASGVLLASGIFAVSGGIQSPLYALWRLQPVLLMTIWELSGLLLFLAAWEAYAASRRPMREMPPPPSLKPAG